MKNRLKTYELARRRNTKLWLTYFGRRDIYPRNDFFNSRTSKQHKWNV